MNTFYRSAVALLLAGCAPGGAPPEQDTASPASAVATPVVTTLDSIALVESDSAFVASPSAIAVAPDGKLAVADGQSKRVLLYDRQGILRNTLGRAGKGPGEFSAPSGLTFVGDTLVAVDDAGAQQTLLFTYPTGTFIRAIRRVGVPITMVTNGNSVWLGLFRNSLNSTITEWDLLADSLRYHGEVPESYKASTRLRQVYGYVAAAVTDNALYYAFVADSAVRVIDRQTGQRTTHAIPARVRRGTAADLATRLEQTTKQEDYASMASSLIALNVPAPHVLQAVHFDVTFAQQVITASGFLSTLNLETGQNCIDTGLKFSQDARPQVTFVGDTLVAIDQAVTGNGTSVTYVRFLAQPQGCPGT